MFSDSSGSKFADEFDFVIVGGGTAGCVLANRLTADCRTRVLLLEDGPSDWNPTIHIPAAVLHAFMNPALTWRHEADPDPARGGKREILYGGRTLGGSSAINGLLFSRGQAEDFDEWAALGNAGWSFADMLPYFKRLETSEIGRDSYRGRGGPLHVSKLRSVHPLSKVFVEAASQCGIPHTDDYNGPLQRGASLAQVTQRRGWRDSASRAFLRPARRRPNLLVWTGTRAIRLLLDARRCVGVEVSRHGRMQTLRATREVILSAGAIGSPKLLKLSGIGPADELKGIGITPSLNLKGVGGNLQEHPNVPIITEVSLQTYNIAARQPLILLGYLAQWLLFGRGPATSPYSQAVAFFNGGDPSSGRPDLELLFSPFAFERDGLRVRPHSQPAMNVIVSLCRPSGRGRVMLSSPDPFAPVRIALELIHDADLPKLVSGCRMARRLIAAPAFRTYVGRERFPGIDAQDDADLTAYIRRAAFAGSHLAGSCRMGIDDAAVVTPRLEVRGVTGLRVVDASIMPTLVSAHTNAAVFAIAERAADLILGRSL